MGYYNNFSVTRTSRTVVKPCEPTPSHTLNLSPIDALPVLRCNARTLHVFKHRPVAVGGRVNGRTDDDSDDRVAADDAACVIRRALSKALVPYYPMAGRLRFKGQQHDDKDDDHDNNNEVEEVEIDCCSEGVWFVEASSSCTLSSVDYFADDVVESVPFHLLPDSVPYDDYQSDLASQPLLIMQVTQFACGGFVIGLIFSHIISDGLGGAQFLKAVGEHARGIADLSTTPAWHRDFFPSPRRPDAFPKLILPPSPPNFTLRHSKFDIPIDLINNLKKSIQQSTGGKTSSTFETLAASFWISRTRAVYYSSKNKINEELKLVFFANCRQFVNPPLPNGFYGNCFFPVTIDAWSKTIAESTISDVVKMIQEAKGKLKSEFGKYLMGVDEDCDHPFAVPMKYTTLFISEWGKLGFNEIDYGWGPPLQVVPIQGSPITPAGVFSNLPLPRKGIRLTTWCVEECHRQSFVDEMAKFV